MPIAKLSDDSKDIGGGDGASWGSTDMVSCEEDRVSGEEDLAKKSLREQLTSMRRHRGSGRRPSDSARLPRGGPSDIAAALEVQQECLLTLLEAQDRHDAMLQSQAKWIVRQVGNIVRDSSGQSLEGAQNGWPERPWGCTGRRASTATCGGPAWDRSPSHPSDREADASATAPALSRGKHYPSEASLAPSGVSVPVSRSSTSLSDFSVEASPGGRSRLTPPEEVHNLEDKLSRLKESDRNFFFWGLANSGGESQRLGRRSTLGGFAYRCTHSVPFEILVPTFIIANACTIGYQADWDMRHHGGQGGSQDLPIWISINRAFALAFSLEIVLRIASEGLHFFHWKNRGFGWNAFDSLIVASSLAEEVAVLAFATRRTRMSSLRVVRVLRLVRALRVIRILRFFRELRIMVSGIMNCGKSLLWASLLIAIMTYTFAVVFLQASFAYLEDPEHDMANGSVANEDCRYDMGAECSVRKNFYSLGGGMYTLFKAMSGGSSWGDVSDDLTEISPLVTFAFCLYIMLAVFVVLNVITAIFVESAQRVSDDEATRILDNIQRKSVWIQNAKELFKILDTRNEGELQWSDINRLFTDERAQSCLQEFGIDLDFQSSQVLFNLFDSSGTGVISEDHFAKTLYRLQGGARSLDLCRIHNTVCSMHKSLRLANRRVDTLASLMGFQLSAGLDRKMTPSPSQVSASLRAVPESLADDDPESLRSSSAPSVQKYCAA